MKLNEEQTRAVEHPADQPACLIAGAGSGKTRVLTERVRYLMDKGITPRRICAITFTNKAADELIHRLGLDTNATPLLNPRVSTIHSLALGGIRKNPLAFGLQHKVTPLDEYDQRQMMMKIIERHKFEEEEVNVYRLLDKISFHRARGVGFRVEYTDDIHSQTAQMHGGYHLLDDIDLELWEEFEREKTQNSVVDFDDMLHLVVRRMRRDEKWKQTIQSQFDHVLMDEAQDTNPVQWEFINGLLAPTNLNFYIVGDISQSIYGFNGAAPELLIAYSEKWREVSPTLYRIARNHRSVPQIVDFANLIQKKMTHTIPLHMESWRGTNGDTGQVKKVVACLPQDIALIIAGEIRKDATKKHDPLAYKDNAILVRAGIQIRDVEGALVRMRIPYIVRGGRGLLQTEEVRDVLAYLRLTANPKDFVALARATSAPRCGVGEAGLEKLRLEANEKYDGNLVEACKDHRKLGNLYTIIEHATLFKDQPITALEKIIAMSNYKAYVQQKYKREPPKLRAKLENLDRFGLMIIMLTQDEHRSLDDLIFQLTLDRPKKDETELEAVEQAFAEGKISQEDRDSKIRTLTEGSVTISTIHSAKGLEWNRVFVPNLVEGSLPHKFSMGSEIEIEEERRLFYVACTRARDTLVLGVPERQQNEANTVRLNPSRFLAEIGV